MDEVMRSCRFGFQLFGPVHPIRRRAWSDAPARLAWLLQLLRHEGQALPPPDDFPVLFAKAEEFPRGLRWVLDEF